MPGFMHPTSHRFAAILLAFALALALAPGVAFADAPEDDPAEAADTGYATAVKAVKAGRYAAAIPLLEKAVAKDPKDANAYNYLAFSHRKLGRFARALDFYKTALKIEPDHRGAHEYLGELYLQTGHLDLAEAHLAKLDRLCTFGCDEYSDLKKAIAAHRTAKRNM